MQDKSQAERLEKNPADSGDEDVFKKGELYVAKVPRNGFRPGVTYQVTETKGAKVCFKPVGAIGISFSVMRSKIKQGDLQSAGLDA